MNAIETLRNALSNPPGTENEHAALAAVDALYQAAKYVAACPLNLTPAEAYAALAAAVRRVEGEQDEPPVSPFHTEPVPS